MTQALSSTVAKEPTERESAGLIIAALLHEVEKLRVWAEAEIAVLRARVFELEKANSADHDMPPTVNWKTIDQVAFDTRFSRSTVSKWCDQGKIFKKAGRPDIDRRANRSRSKKSESVKMLVDRTF